MSEFNFSPSLDHLKRRPDIEGEAGTELGIDGGITLIVLAASDNNPKWRAKRTEGLNELKRLENAHAPADRVRSRAAQLYAESIVIGWYYVDTDGKRFDGPLDANGNAIPFTREACKAFLEEFHDAFTAVERVVYDTKNFRGARVEVIFEAGKA